MRTRPIQFLFALSVGACLTASVVFIASKPRGEVIIVEGIQAEPLFPGTSRYLRLSGDIVRLQVGTGRPQTLPEDNPFENNVLGLCTDYGCSIRVVEFSAIIEVAVASEAGVALDMFQVGPLEAGVYTFGAEMISGPGQDLLFSVTHGGVEVANWRSLYWGEPQGCWVIVQ